MRWIPALKIYAAVSSSRRVAQNILASPDKDLPVYGFYYFRTSLPFYLRRPVGLLTGDGNEMTSNYVVMEYAKWHGAGSPAASGDGRGISPPLSSQQVSPFNGVLMDSFDFLARTSSSSGGTLVLVRNNQVELFMDTVSNENSPMGMWTNWQDSVWKIPASAIQSPEQK